MNQVKFFKGCLFLKAVLNALLPLTVFLTGLILDTFGYAKYIQREINILEIRTSFMSRILILMNIKIRQKKKNR